MWDQMEEDLVLRADRAGPRAIREAFLPAHVTQRPSGRMSTGGMSVDAASSRNSETHRRDAILTPARAHRVQIGPLPRTPEKDSLTQFQQMQLKSLKQKAVRRLLFDCNSGKDNFGYISTTTDVYLQNVRAAARHTIEADIVESVDDRKRSQTPVSPPFCGHCGQIICTYPLPMKIRNGLPTDRASDESLGCGLSGYSSYPDVLFLRVLERASPVMLLYFERKPYCKMIRLSLPPGVVRWTKIDHLQMAFVSCISEKDFDYFDEMFTSEKIETHPLEESSTVFYGELSVPKHSRIGMLKTFLRRIPYLRHIDFDFTLNSDINQIRTVTNRLLELESPADDEQETLKAVIAGDTILQLTKLRIRGPFKSIVAMTPLLKRARDSMETLIIDPTCWTVTDYVQRNLAAFGTALLDLQRIRVFILFGHVVPPQDFEAYVNQFLMLARSLEVMRMSSIAVDGHVAASITTQNPGLHTVAAIVGDGRPKQAVPNPVFHQRVFSMQFLNGMMGEKIEVFDVFLPIEDMLRVLPHLPKLRSCSITAFSGTRLRSFVRQILTQLSSTNTNKRIEVQVLFETMYTRLVDLQRRLQCYCGDLNYRPRHCDRLNCRGATMHFEISNSARLIKFCVTEPVIGKDDLRLFVTNKQVDQVTENEDSDYEQYPDVPAAPHHSRFSSRSQDEPLDLSVRKRSPSNDTSQLRASEHVRYCGVVDLPKQLPKYRKDPPRDK